MRYHPLHGWHLQYPTAFSFIIAQEGIKLQEKAGEHSSPLRGVLFLFVGAICDRPLCCCIQHILNKYSVARGGIVDEDVGDTMMPTQGPLVSRGLAKICDF